MGQPWFLRVLTVSCFLALLFSQGFGRNLMERGDHQLKDSSIQTKGSVGNERKMYAVMEYGDDPNFERYPIAPP